MRRTQVNIARECGISVGTLQGYIYRLRTPCAATMRRMQPRIEEINTLRKRYSWDPPITTKQ